MIAVSMKMKKKYLLMFSVFVFILLAGVGCVAPSQENKKENITEDKIIQLFEFKEKEFDFGIIKQSGGKVSHEFEFIYNGTEPITISGVPTSCACTSAQIDKTQLNPGDIGKLTVIFNPNLHAEPQGKFFKTVVLFTDPKLKKIPEVKIWVEIDLDLGEDAFELGAGHVDEEGEEENGLTSYKSITPEKLVEMLEDKDFTLIDVHIPEQIHIDGTDALIPYNEIEHNSKLPKDRNAKIVLYCRSGGMSRAAAYTLAEEGFINIYDLVGGKNEFDKYLESLKNKIPEVVALGQVGYIEFDAMTITNNNISKFMGEYGDELGGLSLDMSKTNILLSMNNHRTDLTQFDYTTLSKLDGVQAELWTAFSDQVGGHHLAGVLTFAKDTDPKSLIIDGLPVGVVELKFEKI